MANIMDYIDWRGDLSITKDPFNEVDNLILAYLAYVNFDKIVPGIESDDSITIKEASQMFFSMYEEEEILAQVSITKMSAFLMRKMAESDRFGGLHLSKYVNLIDYEEQKQFSAINISLDDGTIYVAFRGTDNTIVGWKENFNMTFISPVPAQLEAVGYLEATVREGSSKLRVGGHSKGGNLAVYAAVKASPSIKEKIIEVFNNDGPGFNKELISSKSYQDMLSTIKTIVPHSSIVGMFLEHEEEYIIVKSGEKVLMQHDPLSWEVLGNHFVYVKHVTKESKLLDVTLKAWLNKMDEKERGQFVEALFYILEETNVKILEDFSHEKWKKMTEIIKVYSNMDPENKDVLSNTIKMLFNESRRVFLESKGEVAKIK